MQCVAFRLKMTSNYHTLFKMGDFSTLEFDLKENVFKNKRRMKSYNNKQRKLLKIHFFTNLRKIVSCLRAHFCVIKQNFETIADFFYENQRKELDII